MPIHNIVACQRTRVLFAVLTLGLWSNRGEGQALYYRSIPIGERAIGLGGAYTGIADDPSATYYNPAGLMAGGRFQLLGVHRARQFPDAGAVETATESMTVRRDLLHQFPYKVLTANLLACTFYVLCPIPGGVTLPVEVRPLHTVAAEEGRIRARLEQTLLLTSAIRASLPELERVLVERGSVEYRLVAPSGLATFSADATGLIGPLALPGEGEPAIPIDFEHAEVEFDHDPAVEFSVDLVRLRSRWRRKRALLAVGRRHGNGRRRCSRRLF